MRRYRSPKRDEENEEVLAHITLYKGGGYEWDAPAEGDVKTNELLGGLEELKMGVFYNSYEED